MKTELSREEVRVKGQFYDVAYKVKNGKIIIIEINQYDDSGAVLTFTDNWLKTAITKQLKSFVKLV